MDTLRELTPQMLARFTQIDYDREMAFIAVTQPRRGRGGNRRQPLHHQSGWRIMRVRGGDRRINAGRGSPAA